MGGLGGGRGILLAAKYFKILIQNYKNSNKLKIKLNEIKIIKHSLKYKSNSVEIQN